ncbi:hypothetical protein BC832DRAFT_522995, partial [Gaertneriomyces semiglobifer]
KPKRPPKPGSKAAINLKKQQEAEKTRLTPFSAPQAEFDAALGVLILAFKDSKSLDSCLGRPHLMYEGGKLKGPLRGINFPISDYVEWVRTVDRDEITIPEQWVLQVVEQSGLSILPKRQTDDTSAASASNFAAHLPVLCLTTPVTYICGYLIGDRSTLLHEWAHAVFCLSPAYRGLCDKLYAELDHTCRIAIQKELTLRNYKEDVHMDEWQAYCVEGPNDFGKKWARHLSEPHRLLRKEVGGP